MRTLLFLFSCLSAFAFAAPSKPTFTAPDLSGIYTCKGNDDHDGPFTSTVMLQLVKAQSYGKFGAYTFKMDVPGYGTYPGYVATDGTTAAISFALEDPTTKDFGAGLAKFSKNKAGKWRFTKYYYQPEFKGGNHGTESCTQQ